MVTVLAIAAGGGLGAVIRHFLNSLIGNLASTDFPLGIFIINILGSFIMGVTVTFFTHFWNPSQHVKAFITVGVLGGFTTFSTYSLDTMLLIDRGALGQAALYSIGSLVLGVAFLFAGMKLVEMFVS